jgi:hypothetical protein
VAGARLCRARQSRYRGTGAPSGCPWAGDNTIAIRTEVTADRVVNVTGLSSPGASRGPGHNGSLRGDAHGSAGVQLIAKTVF